MITLIDRFITKTLIFIFLIPELVSKGVVLKLFHGKKVLLDIVKSQEVRGGGLCSYCLKLAKVLYQYKSFFKVCRILKGKIRSGMSIKELFVVGPSMALEVGSNSTVHRTLPAQKTGRQIVAKSDELEKRKKEANKRIIATLSEEFLDLTERQNTFLRYDQKKEGRKIAFFSAISDHYDSVKTPLFIQDDADYYLFSDTEQVETSVWKIKPCLYEDSDKVRTCRYVKTHPYVLLAQYEVAVWIDSNITLSGDFSEEIQKFIDSGKPIGAVYHPYRNNIYDEAKAVSALGIDDKTVIKNQVQRYKQLGFAHHDLIESNILFFNLKHPKTKIILSDWWTEINQFSKRDQLSLNFVLWKNDEDWFKIAPPHVCARNHPKLIYSWHDANKGISAVENSLFFAKTIDPYLSKSEDQFIQSNKQQVKTVDVVVCVHNALNDVKNCLASIEQTREDDFLSLIIVDDASDSETRDFLSDFAATRSWCKLIRNDVSVRYTKAANLGLKASEADLVILLNSDTVVTDSWYKKLAELASDPSVGIVGPLSNAASFQSIPDIESKNGNTAINTYPFSLSVSVLNKLCETWTVPGVFPRVPLLHGFCLGIKRDLIQSIGYLDEESFLNGYGEENDYCMRAVDAGYELAVATNTFIYHVKSASYKSPERMKLMSDGASKLEQKYSRPRVLRAVSTMRSNRILKKFRLLAAYAKHAHENKLPKVCLVPSLAGQTSFSGSGYVRLIAPWLSKSVNGRIAKVSIHNLGKNRQLPSPEEFDVCILQRDIPKVSVDYFKHWLQDCRLLGKKIVYDLDDDYFDIDGLVARTGRSYADAYTVAEKVRQFVTDSDLVTVSTPSLKDIVVKFNKNVVIIPNLLSELWNFKESNIEEDKVKIGYIGTPSHVEDLQICTDALIRLKKEFSENIELYCVGALASSDLFNVIKVPSSNYPEFVKWLDESINWDIGLIPLQEDRFNASKSNLKFLEYSALGLSIVCSQGITYSSIAQNEKNSLVVTNDTESWYNALKSLIEDKVKRRNLAREASKLVLSDYSVSSQVHYYIELLDCVLATKRTDKCE